MRVAPSWKEPLTDVGWVYPFKLKEQIRRKLKMSTSSPLESSSVKQSQGITAKVKAPACQKSSEINRSVGLMLQCVVNILISTLFVTQVQSVTFSAEDWSLDLASTMKWNQHTNYLDTAGTTNLPDPSGTWYTSKANAGSSYTADNTDIGQWTRNLDQDYFCAAQDGDSTWNTATCPESVSFASNSAAIDVTFELAALTQIRTIYYSRNVDTWSISQTDFSAASFTEETTVEVSEDNSTFVACQDWTQASAATSMLENGFYRCNRYGKYIKLRKASQNVQFADLKIFSEHTSIFYDFVETITASTGIATGTKDQAQRAHPLTLADPADVDAGTSRNLSTDILQKPYLPYISDVPSPAPDFYYYDMVLYYPMSVTGIYIFGNSAAVQDVPALNTPQAITVYYGSSSYPQSNPTVSGNLNQVMAFANGGLTTVISSIRIRSANPLTLGGVTLMIPGQCQDPNDDFVITGPVYVGVSLIQDLSEMIDGSNPDVACTDADITLIGNPVWHDTVSSASGTDGVDGLGVINKLPDTMFMAHNNPTYADDGTTVVLPKRFEIFVTETKYGSASPGTPYVVSVQYTKNGNAGEIFTLFMKFDVIMDCNQIPFVPLAETSVKIAQGETWQFAPLLSKVLDSRGAIYDNGSSVDCDPAIHVTIDSLITDSSKNTNFAQATAAGVDTDRLTVYDFTGQTNAAALVASTYVIRRCTAASCSGGTTQDDNLVIQVGCAPNNIIVEIDWNSYYTNPAPNEHIIVPGPLAPTIESFPTTCMGFYDSSNNDDGYTYNCDYCTVIPWLTYTPPDGNGSGATMGETFQVTDVTEANVGEVWVLTRTYTKAFIDAATSPADSFSDTITIRVIGAANYCPDDTKFVEDAYLAYYGHTKILKHDQPSWSLSLETGIDVLPSSLVHASNCGLAADIEIIPASIDLNASLSAIGPATIALSGSTITWTANSITPTQALDWGIQSFDILRNGQSGSLAPLSINERITYNIILECDITRMWPSVLWDHDNDDGASTAEINFHTRCCTHDSSVSCTSDGDCTSGGGTCSVGTLDCQAAPQIYESYQINVDTYKKITLPTYELDPACNKVYYHDFLFANGTQVPWIKYNSTADEYQIFSDDVSQTGSHVLSVNTGVKQYKQNTYAATTISSVLSSSSYCQDDGTDITGGYSSPSEDNCADRCEATLGCKYFSWSASNCYFNPLYQEPSCTTYASTGKNTGWTFQSTGYKFLGLDYLSPTPFEEDQYGNFTWFNSTSTDESQWIFKVDMISDPCSAVSLTGITLENMNLTTGDILPQTQVIPDLAVNVTCSDLGSNELCCGPRVYTIIDPLDEYGDFFTFSDSTDKNVLTLYSTSYDDVGVYDIQVNVTLADWPNCEPTTLTLTVEVEDCVPELEQSGTLNDYTWNAEQNVGPGVPEGYEWPDLVVDTPIWTMEPLCDLDLVYSVEGLTDFMTYDSIAHTLTVTNTQARNGTYAITIQAYIEEQDILGIDSFDLEIITGETYIEGEPEPEDPRPKAPTIVINEDGEEVDILETLTVSAETINLDLNGLRDYVSEQRDLGNFQFREFSDSKEEEARVVKIEAGDTGQLGVGFPSKVLVFGDGFLPGPESLDIDFAIPVATDDQDQQPERRRLQASPIQGEDYENKILWECSEFTEEGMKFKLSFLNPYEVSTNPNMPENVVIKLKDNTFFNAVTLEPVTGEFSIPLPKQYGNETQKIIVEALGTSFQILMAAAWGLGFILQFWQSTFLYKFWPLYLTVQILASLLILDVSLPTNVTQILFFLKDVIELNFYPREKMLEIYENAPASYRAHEAGGALVSWFIPLCAVFLLIIGLMKIVFKHTDIQCYWCIDRTFEFLFYSLPLRIMLLTFLTFCIVASMGEIWCMVYCPLIAFFTFNYFIFSEPQELNIESTQLKLSTLYQEIKTERTGAVLYTPFFLMTRIVFVFFMSLSIFMLQFFGAIFITMFTLLHLIITRPHTDGRMTNLEIFNNIVLMLCFYLMVAFCPYVNDSQDQYNLGWVFIALLYLLFFVNIGQVIFSVFEILQNKSRLLTMWARAQNRRAKENFGDDVSLISKGSKKKSRRDQDKATGHQSSSRDSIQFLNAALEEDRKKSSGVRNSASRRSNELRPGQSFDFARDQSNENFMV